MSVKPANRLHDLATQLRAWETRSDGYNFRVIDDAFVARMASGKPTRDDYATIQTAIAKHTSPLDHMGVGPGQVDPDAATRVAFGSYLGALKMELARQLGIKEPFFGFDFAALFAGVRAWLPNGR